MGITLYDECSIYGGGWGLTMINDGNLRLLILLLADYGEISGWWIL